MNSQVEGNRRHDKGARGGANKLNGGFSGPQPHLGKFIYETCSQFGCKKILVLSIFLIVMIIYSSS